MKWRLCQELSTKLGTLHEVAVWKIMIAHNNQLAFRRDCLLMLHRGQKGEEGLWRSCILYIEMMMMIELHKLCFMGGSKRLQPGFYGFCAIGLILL